MITIENLRMSYRSEGRGVPVLKGIDLSLGRGEFLTLLGPSGCGKTTLLRCIAGLETPDEGRISIDGADVFNAAAQIEAPPAQRNLGMVFQSYAIWPHMTVFENAAFPLRYRNQTLSRAAVRERTMHCLELVRLDAFADRPAPQLSGGQQQRLALARALCAEPKVLLLDEPLSNLDARLREDMRFELRRITRASSVTTVFVTHEQLEALSMSDRIVVMKDGGVVQSGAPRDLYANPQSEFVATFLGRSNLVSAEIIALDGASGTVTVSSSLGTLCCRMLGAGLLGERVTLVVRPDAIRMFPVSDCGDDGASATVEGAAFLGDYVECALNLAGQALLGRMPAGEALCIGDRVGVAVRGTDVLALHG